MEWIKTILPLIGVVIGWLLSECGKIFANKIQDKRKLKKLLFFLLELRYHFAKELSKELDLDKYIDILKVKITKKFKIEKDDPNFNLDIDTWKPLLEELLSKNRIQDDKFEYLADNIDKILIELAEIFPILAYELSGQHNIKERLNKVDNFFGEIQFVTGEMPFDIKKWVNPKLTKGLLDDLDESIKKIAKQIDTQTLESSNDKIMKMSFEDEDIEIERLIDEYLEKAIESIPQ